MVTIIERSTGNVMNFKTRKSVMVNMLSPIMDEFSTISHTFNDIVEKYKCGLCVDPSNAGAIAETMAWCVEHPEEVMVMGKNGMEAVRTVFNWESESKKLINLYSVLSQ